MRFSRLIGYVLTCAAASAAKQDPCECLKWKDLYKPVPWPNNTDTWPRLVCGEALEWMGMSGEPDGTSDLALAFYAPTWMGFQYHEFCDSFYHRMDNNYCVNTGMFEYGETGRRASQWCVVSSECTELNGGQRISDKTTFYHGPALLSSMIQYPWWRNFWDSVVPKKRVPRDVSWKLCTKEKDNMLRYKDPLEVMELAKSMDSVIGYVTKMAYMRLMPSGPEGKVGGSDWAHVEDLVKKGEVDKMPKPLKDAIAADEAIIIDVDPNGHTHQRIVKGKQVFELDNACGASGCGGKEWPFKRVRDMGEL